MTDSPEKINITFHVVIKDVHVLIILTIAIIVFGFSIGEKLDRINVAQEYRLCTQYGDAYREWAKDNNVEVCKGF